MDGQAPAKKPRTRKPKVAVEKAQADEPAVVQPDLGGETTEPEVSKPRRASNKKVKTDDKVPKGKGAKVPKTDTSMDKKTKQKKETKNESKEGEEGPNAKEAQGLGADESLKSFARRARPGSNAGAIAKWDAVRQSFNDNIRSLAMGKVSTHEDGVEK